MKIIEQSYEILSPEFHSVMDAKDILYKIEVAGRTCYKSEPQGDPGKFVRKIVKRGHHSVIEHANITVRFITDRGVTHELVRHRLAAFSQESTRYCDYMDQMEFIRPVWIDDDNFVQLGHTHEKLLEYGEECIHTGPIETWINAMLDAELGYKGLRCMGWSPQQARAVLPNSLKTEIVMTANLREWRHVLDLRTSQAAHPQIRELMLPLKAELAGYLPEIFA